MRYVREIEFNFQNFSFSVVGKEAQRIYNGQLQNPFAADHQHYEIRLDGITRLISKDSILYIDVLDFKEANLLHESMDRKYNAIIERLQLSDDKDKWYCWMINNGALCVDYGYAQKPDILTSDPKVVQMAKDLLDMQLELDHLLAELEQVNRK